MISEQTAAHIPTCTLRGRPFAETGDVVAITGSRSTGRRERLHVVAEQAKAVAIALLGALTSIAAFTRRQPFRRTRPEVARTVAPWLTVGKVVAWVCLVIVIEVAVGRVLQLAAENAAGRADTSEQAQPTDVVYDRSACPALDRYVNRPTSIDQLHDLRDQLCPTLSGPQRTGN